MIYFYECSIWNPWVYNFFSIYKNIKIISIEQADKSLNIVKFIPLKGVKYAFIFGNEVDGISDDIISVSDEVVEIPQVGTKHSLNVSVAAGIVLWDFFYKTEI